MTLMCGFTICIWILWSRFCVLFSTTNTRLGPNEKPIQPIPSNDKYRRILAPAHICTYVRTSTLKSKTRHKHSALSSEIFSLVDAPRIWLMCPLNRPWMGGGGILFEHTRDCWNHTILVFLIDPPITYTQSHSKNNTPWCCDHKRNV